MAHVLAEHRLREDHDIDVVSAGTHGLVGFAMDAPSARAMSEIGVPTKHHVARRLTAQMVSSADLILTATTEHLDAVLALDPDAGPRAFTMKEFALLGAVEAVASSDGSAAGPGSGKWRGPGGSHDDLAQRVAGVAGRRGRGRRFGPGELNIADPYGGGLAEARSCAAEVSRIVDADLAALRL